MIKCQQVAYLARKYSAYRGIMPLKFAANLSMLFQDIPLLSKRYQAAKENKFHYVECMFPYSEPQKVLQDAREQTGLEHVLINSWPGDWAAGDRGLAALPNRKDEFREKLELSIEYAKALKCKNIHIMAGLQTDLSTSIMEETYLENLQYSAERLQKENMMALIEPINTRISIPGYFLSCPHKAMEYIKKVNHPNLKLQFDVFHIQIMDGNITENLKKYMPYIGHIQIAQVPDRGEPNDVGEINYKHVFRVLESLNYDGVIGLEYKPRDSTLAGLSWMKDCGYRGFSWEGTERSAKNHYVIWAW